MSLAPPTEFDPFSPSVVADPHPHYTALRAASPVHHVVDHDLWLVTRYDDVVRVIRDPLVFSSAEGMGRLMTGGSSGFRPGCGGDPGRGCHSGDRAPWAARAPAPR